MPKEYTDHFATINGLKLHFTEWGESGAPPVVMVHGMAREGHSFDPLARALAPRFRCIVPDVRGRGQSAWGKPEDYGTAQYAADLRGLLAHLGLERVHWVGLSMGGLIGMELAAETPELFRSMTLNDIGPEVAAAGSSAVGDHIRRAVAGFASREEQLAYEVGRNPWYAEWPAEKVMEQYAHLTEETPDGRVVYRFDPNIAQGRATSEQARAAQAARSWQGFRALTCPLLLVRGAESRILSPETAQAMQAAQPHMLFVEIPGVGHTPTLDEAPVLAALETLLA